MKLNIKELRDMIRSALNEQLATGAGVNTVAQGSGMEEGNTFLQTAESRENPLTAWNKALYLLGTTVQKVEKVVAFLEKTGALNKHKEIEKATGVDPLPLLKRMIKAQKEVQAVKEEMKALQKILVEKIPGK